MNKRNYQKELDKVLDEVNEETVGRRPTLLLHSCCAPCSSYVLTYLSRFFDITVFYYNPNIFPPEEFDKRSCEQSRLIDSLNKEYETACDRGRISFIKGDYNPKVFYEMAKGLEDVPEGGERCFKCYELRLREAAVEAKKGNYDYFTTTLTISPLKNAEKLNEIGERIAKEMSLKHLPSDFKKKEGYKQSIELSKKYGLYRQNYCGCVYSRREEA